MDGGIEHRFHVMSICLSYSLVAVLALVSIFVFRVSNFRLFANACVRVRMRFRIVNYPGMRSTTLAVGLVLRNAADAVQLSNMMRILP